MNERYISGMSADVLSQCVWAVKTDHPDRVYLWNAEARLEVLEAGSE